MSRAEQAAGRLRERGYYVSGQMTQAAKAMSERDLDAQIRSLAAGLGIRRFHTWNSRKSEPGFPDLVLVGRRGILFRELKRERQNPTPAQRGWLSALQAAGGDAGVWRPSCLLSGRVARELTAIAGTGSTP